MPPRSMMDPDFEDYDFEINEFEDYYFEINEFEDSEEEEYDKVYYKKNGLRNGVVSVGYNNIIDTVYINSRVYDDDDFDFDY